MTISEVKKLTRFLSEEEIDKIKEEIKSKEVVLTSEKMEEEEMTHVLNTLFAILVIEKTLENEIEDVEDIRAELEQELLEAYEIYDNHINKYKREEKKKKKRWLLDFLFLSDHIHDRKAGIASTNKTINALKNELNAVKQQKSNENLRDIIRDRRGDRFRDFCRFPRTCENPRHHHELDNTLIRTRLDERMIERFKERIENRLNRRNERRNEISQTTDRNGGLPTNNDQIDESRSNKR